MIAAHADESASIIVVTRKAEVLVARRSLALPFLGGFVACPGGRVEDADRTQAARERPADGLGAFKIAGLRELFEETGLDLSAQIEALEPAGHFITPDYSPVRFDTRFFLLLIEQALPLAAVPSSGENEWVRFVPAAELYASWQSLKQVLPPSTYGMARVLSLGVANAAERLAALPGARGEVNFDFEPLPGIRQLPLQSPTLPPATHTNAYVLGDERIAIVDPASYVPEERERLLGYVREVTGRGGRPECVVLTHHHGDHRGAAEWLSDQLSIPILAHPITRDLLAGTVRVDGVLEEGDVLDLGQDASGRPFGFEILHTPGHAPGHVVLLDTREGASNAIVGDMVAAIGTIIIDPSEGDMAEYLRQLARLRARPDGVVFPAHGPPIVAGHDKYDHYTRHRLMREAKVKAALQKHGRGTALDLLPDAYDDTPVAVYPLAERSCLAHLIKLANEGLIARGDGDVFSVLAG